MNRPSVPFESAFREFVQILETLPHPYCVLGALALGVWGVPRTTQDLDAMIAVASPDQERFLQTLSDRGLVIDSTWADENPMVRDRHLRFRLASIPVDLLLPRDAHDHMLLTRRARQMFEDLSFWVISSEDLILHKLKVGRPRDFEDVVAVIVRQSSRLDVAYLREWAQRLGISEELAYCLGRS